MYNSRSQKLRISHWKACLWMKTENNSTNKDDHDHQQHHLLSSCEEIEMGKLQFNWIGMALGRWKLVAICLLTGNKHYRRWRGTRTRTSQLHPLAAANLCWTISRTVTMSIRLRELEMFVRGGFSGGWRSVCWLLVVGLHSANKHYFVEGRGGGRFSGEFNWKCFIFQPVGIGCGELELTFN